MPTAASRSPAGRPRAVRPATGRAAPGRAQAAARPVQRSRAGRARGSASVAIAGVGRVCLWEGGSLWIGHSAGGGAVHAHHAIQICLPLDVRVRFRRSATTEWDAYDGAIVRPDEPHQFDGCNGRVAQLFVEPETAVGRVLLELTAGAPITPLTRGQAQPLAQALFAAFDARPDAAAMQAAAEAALQRLACCAPRPSTVDPRIVRVQDALRRRVADAPTLAEAAALVHLSPGRLRHLFVAQTGISFRAYLVWLRLHAALAAFDAGRTWTEAAHRAGFADSPHLSRSFRRVFGVSPVMLVRA
jgi:AraC-like DNA-binding protein